jgi:cyclophilin family peptidyl-prolyl cis-trans isomerase
VATHQPPTDEEARRIAAEAAGLRARVATKHGDVVLEFFPDVAPVTVASFVKLARAGFYDGLIFHRVEPGFVVQGGDPTGTGTGDPGYKLKAEFNERPSRIFPPPIAGWRPGWPRPAGKCRRWRARSGWRAS